MDLMGHEHQRFHNSVSATPIEVRMALGRGEVSNALDAMVGAVLYGDGDWEELQDLYLALLDHDDR
ncbi:hypothetical protein OHA21_00290 [Actinoplanes sp. NBC_00393]|uniref:hypothetical protein n=1 Tax=Actinoplanes sp. NBC_00393 TaxID=2975953 RepID=UPI002E21BCA0